MGTYVITGAASGIGRTTSEILTSRGHRVVGVDLAGVDVDADLSTPDGRERMVEEVRGITGGRIDAVIACAGLSTPTTTTVRVNFYGAVATLQGLRPLLAGSPAPRAAAVASMASLFPPDEELLTLLLEGTEDEAVARAEVLAADERAGQIYGTSKRALALWVRAHAATPEWAGAGIPLNAVAPGIIRTPMTTDLLTTEESTKALLQQVPMPLNGVAEPETVGYLLAWLTGEENTHLCGQVVFVDGGSDAVIRGASTW
ncbi:SDR family oxidoreductase [Georgenia sp. M64]|uniref:SDR family oxidoreductase n=1 Tax=Georgenia sp. M64 TaxID=3120520 RepID=UPI0030E2D5EF